MAPGLVGAAAEQRDAPGLRVGADRHQVRLGFQSLDYWNQAVNERVLNNEIKKLDAKGKRELADRLLKEAQAKAAE